MVFIGLCVIAALVTAVLISKKYDAGKSRWVIIVLLPTLVGLLALIAALMTGTL